MSNNIDLNLSRELSELGLSDKEAQVYITLLAKGDMSAIGVSKYLGLHRQFVYTALDSLAERGFVSRFEGKRTKWHAQNPRRLITLAEIHQRKAADVAERLLALKPIEGGQEFEVSEGEAAFRASMLSSIRNVREGTTVLMICGEWDRYFERAGDAHAAWDSVRIEKRVHFRIIGPESMRASMDEAAATRALTTYRTLPHLEENLINTIVYDDEVVTEIYGDPHLTFSVRNPIIAESQKTFFETLWNLAKD